MSKVFRYLLLSATLSVACHGFLFGTPRMTQKPELLHITDSQTGTLLNIRMDVGKDEQSSRMNVNGLLLELTNDIADQKTYQHPKMPGANGPYPQISSGIRKLNLLQKGHFIDMNGANYVDFRNGCWELAWRDGAAAGMLICGFDLPRDYHRNDATLPQGRIFLSFPIWTRAGLDDKQQYRRDYERMAKRHILDKDEELAKLQATNNIFMKAWHFRNACAAVEKLSLLPMKEVSMIPLDHEVIYIQDDLLLTTKGLVWSKEEAFLRNHDILLGSAFVSAGEGIKAAP